MGHPGQRKQQVRRATTNPLFGGSIQDLGSDTPGTLEKTFRFLGVKCSQEIVESCCVDGSFERLSGGRSRGQENRESFFRKRIVGDWRNYLSDEMDKIFQEKAGEWLARFGYI